MKVVILGALALAASLALSACIGTTGFAIEAAELFWLLRAPRLALGLITGAALAMSGVGSQALLRNALADPYVLGVSGGAALGGVLASTLFAPLPFWAVMLSAWIGAWTATIAIFVRERQSGMPASALLLVGVVFNAFAAAVITLIKTLVSATKAQEVLFWLMGQFTLIEGRYLLLLAICTGIGAAALFAQARELDVLVQGDDIATTLGVDPKQVRRQIYFALTLLVGSVVAATGMVSFVGLVVPHVVRGHTGPGHRLLLLASGLWGATLVILADMLCRLGFVWFATELPVGVLTAFVGAPYFIWALRRSPPALLFA